MNTKEFLTLCPWWKTHNFDRKDWYFYPVDDVLFKEDSEKLIDLRKFKSKEFVKWYKAHWYSIFRKNSLYNKTDHERIIKEDKEELYKTL